MVSEDLREFFQKKGAIELIFAIDKENGNIQNEIAENIDISEPSVSDRLDEADDLELVDISRSNGDHGNAKRYYLKSQGLNLRNEFESRDLVSKYYRHRELKSDLNEGIKDVLENLDELIGINLEDLHTDWTDTETITERNVPEDFDSSDVSRSSDYDIMGSSE
jgi:DNA-binding MarR family transcriptional regulator